MRWSLVSFVPLLAACSSATPGDLAADVAAIDRLAAAYGAGFVARDVDAILACATDDHIAMSPEKPAIIGREAVGAEIARDFEHYVIPTLTFTNEEVVVNGDWAWARGSTEGTFGFRSGGPNVRLNGKYLWILRRQPDGAWLIARNSANGNGHEGGDGAPVDPGWDEKSIPR